MSNLAVQRIDTTLPVKSVQTARSLFESDAFAAELGKALARRVPTDYFLRVALTALQRSPKLLECDGRSLCGALMECAQLGLEPRGRYGAHIVPFRNKKTGRTEATVIVDYLALKNKVIEAKAATSIFAASVYEGDEFSHLLGDNPMLTHEPRFKTGDDADLIFVYAIARLPDGTRQYCVLPRFEIDRAKARSKASDYGPWVTDFAAMAMKTAIRRLCKGLYIPPALVEAIDRDETREIGDSVVESLDMTAVDAEPERPVAIPITSPDGPRRGRPRKMVTEAPAQAELPLEREPGDEEPDPKIDAAFGGKGVEQ